MRVAPVVLAAFALAPAARAADVTMVARDVPLGSRVLATASAAGRSPARFNMVALHWQGSGTPAFSVREASGRWSPWQEADDDWGRAGAWRKQGSPAWTGTATAIRYRLAGRVTRLRAYFLWSPPVRVPTRRLSIAGSPAIIPRSGWHADESIRRAPPQYAPTLRFALVHHTVNSNDYTAAQSASIVRGIEVYHVKANGWNDIGYNFLVDRYGQIFEGRYGGIDRNVVGAHSQGFNTGSVGVAVIGDYQDVSISAAAKNALVQLLAWRLDVAHLDPLSFQNVLSGGNSRFPAGAPVVLRAISGHRDTYFTECPGNQLYAQIPSIAKAVAATGLPKLYAPAVVGKIGGAVRFTARLSSAVLWTVTVTDSTGAVVASGSGVGPTVDWTWDATAVAPGSYRWSIGGGPDLRPATGTIGAKASSLAITGLVASPAVISPNGDGVADSATVTYTLDVPATVTATLLDSGGASVATLFSEPKVAGKQSFLFTVGDDVPDGQYTMVLQAESADGQEASASVTVEIDRTVQSFAVTPAAISPNGDGRQDAATATFTLVQPATVELDVVQGTEVVTTLLSESAPAGVPQTVTWGGPAPDGTYSLRLTAGPVVRTLPLVVDTRRPVLRAVSWRALRFHVSEAGSVTLRSGASRWTRKARVAGTVSFALRRRPRTYTVVARDAAGNVSLPLRAR
jgi:hypothetical protein